MEDLPTARENGDPVSIQKKPMQRSIEYRFSATVWQHNGPGGWFFVSMPVEMSAEIRAHLQWQEEGWGRLKAKAGIGKSQWDTAIWFDTKRKTYLLPLKADIRKRENLKADVEIDVAIWI